MRGDRWVHVAIAVIAVVLCLVVTRHRVGFDTDSGVYLGTAQNIVDGRGVTTPFPAFTSEYGPRAAAGFRGEMPLTHYPPLYPVLIAGVGVTGIGVEGAARVLGALLLGVNLVLLGLLARRALRSTAAIAMTVALALSGPVSGVDLGPAHSWLFQHSLAMSESLFIALALGALLLLERHIATGDRRLLFLAAAFAGLATGTRYVGVALVAAGLLVLLPRWRDAALFALVSAVPTAVWTLTNTLFFGGAAPRSLHLSNPHLGGIVDVAEGWLGLARAPTIVGLTVLVVVVATMGVVVARESAPVLRIVAWYAVAYFAAVVATRAFFDLSTPFNDRVFSPLQGPFYVLLLGALATWRAPLMRFVLVGLPVVLFVVALPAGWRVVNRGIPPAPPAEDVFAATNDLPPDALIATNVPTRLWEINGRASISVPARTVAVSGDTNTRFVTQLHELVDVIGEQHGYIVLLGPPKAGFAALLYATEQDLESFPALRVARRTSDGVILEAS